MTFHRFVCVAGLALVGVTAAAAKEPVLEGSEINLGMSEVKQLVEAERPAVARNDDGAFVVAWERFLPLAAGSEVVFQRFDSTGTPLDAKPVAVATDPNDLHEAPDAAMDPNGGFVVVWVHKNDVFSRRYDAAGMPLDANSVLLSPNPGSFRSPPRIAMNRSGEWIAAWRAGTHVVARRFLPDGTPIDPQEFLVTTDPNGSPNAVDVDLNDFGESAVVWSGSNANGKDTSGVFMRRFDGKGQPLDLTEFQVNTFTANAQVGPVVSLDDDRRAVAAWTSFQDPNGRSEIYARRFGSGGNPRDTHEFRVHRRRFEGQLNPDIFASDFGGFTIVFQALDANARGIHARRFQPNGTPLDAVEFQINTTVTGNQRHPVVSGAGNGDFIVAWQDEEMPNTLNSEIDVAAQQVILDANADPPPIRVPFMRPSSQGTTLDCSDPSDPNTRPEIRWGAGDYTEFKVFLASSPGFEKITRVTSGKQKIKGVAWTPGRKKWQKACNKALLAGSQLFIEVKGFATYLPKEDPRKKAFSDVQNVSTSP